MSEINNQTEANKRWQQENKERAKYLSNRSRARSFIKNQAKLEDLDELQNLISESKERLAKGLKLESESANLINQIKRPIINHKSSPHFVAGYFKQSPTFDRESPTTLSKIDGTYYTISEVDSLLKVISSNSENEYNLTFSIIKNVGEPMYYFSDLSGPINNDEQ